MTRALRTVLERQPPTGRYTSSFLSTLSRDWTFSRASKAAYFDSTGVFQTATADTPAITWDPTTLQPQGLGMWQQITNSHPNPRGDTFTPGVIGSGGVLPTGWVIDTNAGLSINVIGQSTAINGLPSFDIRFSGTSTGTYVVLRTNLTVTTAGQTWTQNVPLAQVGGTTNGITSIQASQRGNGTITPSNLNYGTLFSNSWTYAILTAALSGANTGNAAGVVLNITNGAAVDITLRFGAMQFTQTAFAGPFILPDAGSPGISTRSVDSCAMTTAAFIRNVNTTASEIIADATVGQLVSSGFATLFCIDDGTNANKWTAFQFGTTMYLADVVSSSLIYQPNPITSVVAGAPFRLTAALTPSAGLIALNGSAAVSGAGAPFANTTLRIGGLTTVGNAWNGYIRKLTIQKGLVSTALQQTGSFLGQQYSFLSSLSPDWVFTRASGGWSYNSSGVLAASNFNVPRLDYDPVALTPRGLLMEAAAVNLLTQPVGGTAWLAGTSTTVSLNAASAPDGTSTATQITDTATGGNTGYVQSSPSSSIAAATNYTASAYLKAGTLGFAGVQPNFGSGGISTVFNLSTGAVFNTVTFGTGMTLVSNNSVYVGNGWWRCSVTFSSTGTSGSVWLGNSSPASSNLTFLAWGAQLEQAAAPTSYCPATNMIRNSSAVGAVPGTPGTLPTNWSVPTGNGLTQQIVGSGTEGGIPYVDLRFSGTTSGTYVSIWLEANSTVAAAAGQTWTIQSYLRLVGGSLTNLTSIQHILTGNNSSGVYVENHYGPPLTPTSASLASQPNNYSAAYAGGTVAYAVPVLNIWTTASAAVDITLRIGAPNLTQTASAYNPIFTTGSILSRATDNCTLSAAAFAKYVNTAQGTVVVDAMVGQLPIAVQTLAELYGDANNKIGFYTYSTSLSFVDIVAGSNTAVATAAGTVPTNSAFRGAATYASGGLTITMNGGTPIYSAGALPAFTSLRAGHHNGDLQLNGWIRGITLYPSAMSTAQLQAASNIGAPLP